MFAILPKLPIGVVQNNRFATITAVHQMIKWRRDTRLESDGAPLCAYSETDLSINLED
jgi:hypothetical protein